VTHERKTPLASLRLLAEMLDEGRVRAPAQQREYFRMLAGETVRLQALIDNVLDLGRMERGERALDLRPCELGEVVRDAVAVFAPVAARDGRTVTVRGDEGALPVRADRAGLTQALLNVLDNARKYGAGARIEVTLAAGPHAVRVAVRDFGPGVPPAERERIFERFVRGAAQAAGDVPGVGLGLYLARAIARAHGGELRCEAPDDGGPGAVFAFVLPLAQRVEVRA
jgi:two-component system phosphate regulon sensor histidine kinase PhoR